MEKYDYTYNGSENYCYPGTDVLYFLLIIENIFSKTKNY
jgi:hypothetical protein